MPLLRVFLRSGTRSCCAVRGSSYAVRFERLLQAAAHRAVGSQQHFHLAGCERAHGTGCLHGRFQGLVGGLPRVGPTLDFVVAGVQYRLAVQSVTFDRGENNAGPRVFSSIEALLFSAVRPTP